MDGGEALQNAWHYTTVLDLTDHWQSLIGGIFALVAAAFAVVGTAWIERRKARVEDEALRSSLAVELRIFLPRACTAHEMISRLATQKTPITSRQVESLAQMPIPVVYPANAYRIGLLGPYAIDVVGFYGAVEAVVAKARELQRYRTPDDISPQVVAGLGDGFLRACRAGIPLLANLKSGAIQEQAVDLALVTRIHAALASRPML